MSIPAAYALDLYRGDTFALTVKVWTDDAHTIASDLTGATARAQLRSEATLSLIAEFVCTVTAPNIIGVSLAASAWPATTVDTARWDLQLTYLSGNVRTILAGPVRIIADVTVAA